MLCSVKHFPQRSWGSLRCFVCFFAHVRLLLFVFVMVGGWKYFMDRITTCWLIKVKGQTLTLTVTDEASSTLDVVLPAGWFLSVLWVILEDGTPLFIFSPFSISSCGTLVFKALPSQPFHTISVDASDFTLHLFLYFYTPGRGVLLFEIF